MRIEEIPSACYMFTGGIWYYTLGIVSSVVTLVNQNLYLSGIWHALASRMDTEKRCVSIRLDCDHTTDTILGSLINVIGWAFAIT